ncbi:MAG: dipeptide/oligopeptide/nickel ABC transporter ATP-binding protein [Pseudomonadota bacterium]|nr:dipeptide/oligopeptide/nickel ABC transporter ATP-binding protein [Pseudomonadota bacterium]
MAPAPAGTSGAPPGAPLGAGQDAPGPRGGAGRGPEPLLHIRGLRKHYGGRLGGAPTVAVGGVDLDVHPGEVVGLIGESGCGKTTLVRAALGLLRRDGGTVRILGQDPQDLGGTALTALRRRAQLLLQDPGASLNPGLTLLETVAESARVHRRTDPRSGVPTEQPGAARAALERLGLGHRAGALPHELSGGEKRRATLAMLWLADPLLTIADEPTAGLDAARKAEVLDLLLERRRPDTGFLLISHDLPLVLYACTRVLVMSGGRLVDGFTPAALAGGHPGQEGGLDASPRHPLTRRLLWAAGMLAEPA